MRQLFGMAGGLVLSLSAWVGAGPTTLPSLAVPDSVGVNIHFTDAKPGEMEMLAAGGFGWVRMDMLWNESWSSIERVKGVYDFAKYDRLVAGLQPHGIRMIAILAYGNPLYDQGLSPHTDEGREAYARWAVAAAKHFAGRGILWETWNEPNGRMFWKPTPNADDYAQLALATAKAMRREVPDEAVVGPALAKMDWPFLETCFKAGLLEYWSAVTVHPYRNADPETVAEDYRKLRRMIAQYAPPGKTIPIISSEWGYFLTLGPTSTPERQGKLLARQWLTNLANEVPLSIWYDWKDDGTNPNDCEHHFGTVGYEYLKDRQPVYEPKPGYLAARTLTRVLGGCRFSGRLPLGTPSPSSDDHVLLFEKNGQVRLVAWTQGGAHDLTIPASPGRFSVTSHLGEALPTVTADGRGLTLHLTDAPQYLVPESSNDLLALAAAWVRLPLDTFVAGPGNAVIKTTLRNVTAQTIHVKSSAGQSLALAAGQAGTILISRPVLRSEVREPVRLELDIEGMGRIAQETRIAVTNALKPCLLPVGERVLLARIENPSGQAFAGTVTMVARNGSNTVQGTAPLELRAGEREKLVRIQTAQPLPANASVDVTMQSNKGQPVAASTLSYNSDPAEGLGGAGYTLWPQKDQSWVAAAAPEPPPTARGPVMKLDYQFTGEAPAPAGKSATTRPAGPPPVVTLAIGPRSRQDKLSQIQGQPKALVMWIYGDGSGNSICARFTDATGAVFQPAAEPIRWKGWRCVSFPLDDPAVWHWGGAKEDVIRYPIQWHTLFLMDAAGKKSGHGTIYLCSPTVVWDEAGQEK